MNAVVDSARASPAGAFPGDAKSPPLPRPWWHSTCWNPSYGIVAASIYVACRIVHGELINCSASDVFRAMLGLIMYVVVCIASLSTSFPALCNISTVLGCARLASHCLYAAVMVIGMAPVIVVWSAQLLQCTVLFGIHICIGIAGTAYTCMWLAFHCCGSAMLS